MIPYSVASVGPPYACPGRPYHSLLRLDADSIGLSGLQRQRNGFADIAHGLTVVAAVFAAGAGAERRLLNLQKKLGRLKLLIVDELGFVPLSKTGAELLFEVFSQR